MNHYNLALVAFQHHNNAVKFQLLKGKISTKRSNANDSMLMSSFLTSCSEFEVR